MNEVHQIFQAGYLKEAQSRAENGRLAFAKTNPEWAARFRTEEARVRLFQGESAAAVHLLKDDWTYVPADREVSMDRAIILSLAEAKLGNDAQAKMSMAAATALCNCGTGSPNTRMRGNILSAKGSLALEENSFPAARTYFLQALEAARTSHDRYLEARMRLNLSVVDLQENRYEDALEQSELARDIAKKIGAQLLVVGAQGNSGWAYYATGDYQRALGSFNDASASAAKLGSTSDEEFWSHTKGMSEARLGDLDAARNHYEHALALARSQKNVSEIVNVDETLASLLLHTSHPAQATPYIQEIKVLAQQSMNQPDIEFGALLEAEYLAQRGDPRNAIAQLIAVERETVDVPVVQLDAQHTLAQLYEKLGQWKPAEAWYQRSISTYREQRSHLQTDDARLPFFANGRDLYMDYVAFLVRNHRTDEALAVIDQGRAETLAEGLGLGDKKGAASTGKVSLTTLARQAHAVILVYALSPQGSYLWAANSRQSGFYQLPDRPDILAQIASHRRAVLAARDLVKEQNPAARKLYDMLVKPAEHLIHPGDHVFIVADDGMHGLNFESLLTPRDSSHYWIEDVTITNLASLRLLAPAHRRARETGPQQRLLVIGNPVYSGNQYAPLPNAAAEVTDVAGHFPASAETVLTGTNAAPDTYLRSEPSRFEYIHFVSHAVASELVPLDSAVILSPHGSADSAKLYARDILSNPLRAQLVTISACQGSGVRAYAGEGLVGLAWAFLRAGSHNVIGALWDVSDASTPELMQHLYDGIAAGKSPDVSLRAAKLEMLHSRGVFRKPIYWSAFQLYSAGR